MKDRIPLYPGRVKLNPVTGQENTYDMVRADEPTQEGTPLNKASLLKDETAALYGQGVDAVPDDILSILSKAVLSIDGSLQDIGGNKVGPRIATGSYAGTGTYGASNPCSLTFDFEPKIVIVQAYLKGGSGISPSMMVIITQPSPYGYLYGYEPSAPTAPYVSVFGGKTISWYHKQSNAYQMNYTSSYAPQSYAYVAIG